LFAAAEQQHRLGHIAERMAAVIGGHVQYIDWPEDKRRLEVGDAVISAARARSLLGWQATTDLDAGLAATAAYYRDRLEDYL
jgi:UDP-glucose 4-epimerase